MRTYLLFDVASLTETVKAYSSQGSAALQIGLPFACDEGLGTAYGPPAKVSGPLLSVSVLPLVGVVSNIEVRIGISAGIASERGASNMAVALADRQSATISATLNRRIFA